MSKLAVSITSLDCAGDEFSALQNQLHSTASTAAGVKNRLNASLGGAENIGARLGKTVAELELNAEKLGRLSQGLHDFARIYRDGEAGITGNADSSFVLAAEAAAAYAACADKSARSIIKSIIDKIRQWLGLDDDGKTCGDGDADTVLRNNITKIFEQSKYNQSQWDKASSKERVKIMESLIADLNKTMGTDVSTKINTFYDDYSDGYITHGYLSSSPLGKMRISMNTYDIELSSYKGVMTTLVHEMRHGYQHTVVNHPENFCVDQSTVDAWSENFRNYKTTDKDGFNAYLAQPVEADAREFADSVRYNET